MAWTDSRPKNPTEVSDVPATDFDAERSYDDERFSTSEVFHSDRMKIVCGYFEPGQFIPVHAPDSDVAIIVRSGSGVVRGARRIGRSDPVMSSSCPPEPRVACGRATRSDLKRHSSPRRSRRTPNTTRSGGNPTRGVRFADRRGVAAPTDREHGAIRREFSFSKLYFEFETNVLTNKCLDGQ